MVSERLAEIRRELPTEIGGGLFHLDSSDVRSPVLAEIFMEFGL